MVDQGERIKPVDDSDLAARRRDERAEELGRLISLSDGVFAFAMTLLVVTIDVPDLSGADANASLVRDVRDSWPQILSFVIGFLVIALLWGAHRRTFSRVRDFDSTLEKLNIALLLMIAFLPFPTGILGEYGELAFPSIFYAVCIAAISVIFVLILDHLDRHRALMTRSGAGFDFSGAKTRHLVTAAIFLLSIPVAMLVPGAGQLTWSLLLFNHWISKRVLPSIPRRFQG